MVFIDINDSNIFFEYGEEKFSRRVAKNIVEYSTVSTKLCEKRSFFARFSPFFFLKFIYIDIPSRNAINI